MVNHWASPTLSSGVLPHITNQANAQFSPNPQSSCHAIAPALDESGPNCWKKCCYDQSDLCQNQFLGPKMSSCFFYDLSYLWVISSFRSLQISWYLGAPILCDYDDILSTWSHAPSTVYQHHFRHHLGLPLLHWSQIQISEFVSLGHLYHILQCLKLSFDDLLKCDSDCADHATLNQNRCPKPPL